MSPLRNQQVNAIYRFVTMVCSINITITIVDLIHRPVLYLKHIVSGLDSVSVFRLYLLSWAQST
jgi:hypothetical protein